MTRGRIALGALICMVVIVVGILLASFLGSHPLVVYIILGIVGLIALLASVYAGFWFVGRISEHSSRIAEKNHQAKARKLALEAKAYEIEQRRLADQRAWDLEQQDLLYERQERQRAWEVEQRRLQLEEQERLYKLRADQDRFVLQQQIADRDHQLRLLEAQAIRVKSSEALVMRRGTDYEEIVYNPRPAVRVTQIGDNELISEADLDQIEGPKFQAPSAIQLLQRGELDQDDIVLGTDSEGALVRRTWKQLLSILILGLMGGGKTNTALWIVLQLLLKRYKVALIDRHAKSDESTYARLKDFKPLFDVPVGDSPQAALRAMKHVRRVFEDRRDNGATIDYKLIFMIDELTAMLRVLKDNNSEWQEVAIFLAALIEDLNYEGRKYGVHVIAVGQAANASRTGGTEIRDLFHTRITHGMRARQAQMLGLTDEKAAIQKLEVGQVYIDVEGKDDPFFTQVPEVTEEFRRAVLARLGLTRVPAQVAVQPKFTKPINPRSVWVPEVSEDVHGTDTEPSMNAVQHSSEPLNERAQKVLELRNLGMGKAAIIEEMWRVKKGGSAAYKQAESEYTQIIELLTQLDYIKLQ